MKLRTQFLVLICGMVLLPLLAIGIYRLAQSVPDGREAPLNVQINSWLRGDGTNFPPSTAKDLVQFIATRPSGVESMLISPDGTVVYSTIPGFSEGQLLNDQNLVPIIRKQAVDNHMQFERPRFPGVENFLLLLQIPKSYERPPMKWMYLPAALAMSAMLLFAIGASLLILRSLNKSLVGIEAATRRVAEGDLDFDIPRSGTQEISSLRNSFNQMRVALREESARRSRFVMGLSHDLKTPLTLISGYVDALIDGVATNKDTQKQYLSIISEKARSLEDMISDLINFVKLDTAEWLKTLKMVDCAKLLRVSAQRFKQDALLLHRDLDYDIRLPAPTYLEMDEVLFLRALENLVSNAIRYTGENGKIRIDAWLEQAEPEAGVTDAGEILSISVRDSGVGIAAADLDRIFDPLYRGSSSRREQGYGLGLAVVKSVVESHGWKISVDSREGEGASFIIRAKVQNPDRATETR